jgi:hypothetical protein
MKQEAGKEKNVIIAKKDNGRFYHVYFETGGQLPQEFTGVFTNYVEAEKAVETYKARKSSSNSVSK